MADSQFDAEFRYGLAKVFPFFLKKGLIGDARIASSSTLLPGTTGACSLETASPQATVLKISKNIFKKT